MPANDPLMSTGDMLPLAPHVRPNSYSTGPAPWGLRFATTPNVAGKHEKSYYTVTVQEATQISRDGRVETIQDDVQRERED